MPYFLYEGRLECGQEAELIGTEAAHASKSRRLREGEVFEVQDEQLQRFEAKVQDNARNRLRFIVENRLEPPPESSLKLELWQALPREKALEMILQKGTELGVSKFVLFPGYFSQGMRHASKQQDALRRWERICREACILSTCLIVFFAYSGLIDFNPSFSGLNFVSPTGTIATESTV